jgi:hypothetical protein
VQSLQQSIEILVEMDVNRYREYPEDGLVEVHAYGGDYGFMLCLPIKDKRVQKLKQQTSAHGASPKTS